MIVDTSVLVSIMRGEDEAEKIVSVLASDPPHKMSAGSWIELGAVTSNWAKPDLLPILDQLMTTFAIAIEPVTAEQARLGHEAYRRFGKGHHPARLNFGDCFAYALAKATGEPLLFKGDDFVRTDIVPALPPRP